MNREQLHASTDGTPIPVAVLSFWDEDGAGFLDYNLDTLGITIDSLLPGVVWLVVNRRDGPSVRIRVTPQLSVLTKSALNTARDLAALDGLPANDHHEHP